MKQITNQELRELLFYHRFTRFLCVLLPFCIFPKASTPIYYTDSCIIFVPYVFFAKRVKYALFLSLLLLATLCSCNQKEKTQVEKQLELCDSLVYTNPDSVLTLLEKADTTLLLNEATKAHYDLLLTMARDKAYLQHTDTLRILRATTYYDKLGNNHQRALAHFYSAMTYRYMNLQTQMLTHLLQAEYCLGKSNVTDKRLKSLVHFYLGYTFYLNRFYDKAKNEFVKNLDVARELQDDSHLYYAYIYLGAAETFLEEYDSANIHLQKAIPVILKTKRPQDVSDAYMHLARLNKFTNDKRAFLKYAKLSCETSNGLDIGLKTMFLGDAFHENEMDDSAKFYLNKALCDDNNVNSDVYMHLADIYKKEDSIYQSNEYERLYNECQEQLLFSKKDVKIVEIEKDYNLWLQHQHHDKSKKMWLVFIIIITVVCYLSFVVWNKKQKNNVKKAEGQYKEAVKLSKKQSRIIKNLKIEKKTEEKRVKNLQNNIAKEKNDIVAFFQSASKKEKVKLKVTATDWMALEHTLNKTQGNFIKHIRKQNPSLNEEGIRLYMLMKIGLTNVQIANIFIIEPESAKKRKQRLKKRINYME